MSALAYQQVTIAGLSPTFVAASGGGDTIPANDHGFLRVKNGGGSSITVTINYPGNNQFGSANPDPTVSVAAGGDVSIGPFPAVLLDPSTGAVDISYSAVTSVTVAAVSC